MKKRYRFEARDQYYGHWSEECAGQQDESNYVDSREEAESMLGELAAVLGIPVKDVRVVEVVP